MSIIVSLIVCGATGLYLTEGQQLVSVGKTISISSPITGWPVQNAVDGKPGTTHKCDCCAATSNTGTENWYLLDLQQAYEIVRIEVLGRTDFDHFLNHMEISVGITEGSLTSLLTTNSTFIREYSHTLSPVRSARYVKLTRHAIDHFVVCELSVYADCADGRYGPECGSSCGHCAGTDMCDKVNGKCPSGCDAGYQGDRCDQECSAGTYGSDCSQTCGKCNNDDICDNITGTCIACRTGYSFPMCQDCVDGRYGPECGSSCGQCAGIDMCDKVNGKCPSGCNAGYQGDKCDQDCNAGSYGPGCSQICGECNNDAHCNHITGMCASCKTGFLNPMCQVCVDGRYGPECGSSCGQCLGTDTCDKVTGNCPSGCNAGFQNNRCDQVCNAGTYGLGCSQICGQCNNDAVCNHVTGTCTACTTGYLYPMCQDCADQWYGPNCGTECGHCVGVCDKSNGDCPADGCAAGYQGDKCDQGSEVEQEQAASSVVALPVFVGVVGVLGLLVILSVVVNIVLIRRTSTSQKEQNTDQRDTTNRYETPLDISSQYGNNPTQPDPGQYEMLSGDRVQRTVPNLDYETLKPDDVNYEN